MAVIELHHTASLPYHWVGVTDAGAVVLVPANAHGKPPVPAHPRILARAIRVTHHCERILLAQVNAAQEVK